MKVKHYLETILGIEIYPLISLVIFVVFFAIMLLYVLKMDKEHIKEVEHLPLEDDSNDRINSNL
jgi:hypothetical protein